MIDDDPMSGVCVPVGVCSVLGVRAPLVLIVDSDCVEYTDVPPGGTFGVAAVGRLNRGVPKRADEREERRLDGLPVELLYFSG